MTKDKKDCKCIRCIRKYRKTISFQSKNGFIEIPLDACEMIICEYCGNKRCPHATDHRNECTQSNETGQKGSIYE